MSLESWIPGVSSAALLAAALWLARNIIATRLTKSVEHEFNEKLESLRASLRETEERLKADLRLKEAEISALRGGALSVLAARQLALEKRRLEAVDQLWTSVTVLAPGRLLVSTIAVIKFESAAAHAEKDPKARELFQVLGGNFDLNKVDLSGAALARPHVSAMVWASYSAMVAVMTHASFRLHVLRGGLGVEDFANNEAILKLVAAALPHFKDYVAKNGPSVYPQVLEALEAQLLDEMQKMLRGVDADKESLERSAEILRQANAITAAGQSGKVQAQ